MDNEELARQPMVMMTVWIVEGQAERRCDGSYMVGGFYTSEEACKLACKRIMRQEEEETGWTHRYLPRAFDLVDPELP